MSTVSSSSVDDRKRKIGGDEEKQDEAMTKKYKEEEEKEEKEEEEEKQQWKPRARDERMCVKCTKIEGDLEADVCTCCGHTFPSPGDFEPSFFTYREFRSVRKNKSLGFEYSKPEENSKHWVGMFEPARARQNDDDKHVPKDIKDEIRAMEPEFAETKCMSITFALSRFGSVEKTITFDQPFRLLDAVQTAEIFLSEKATEEYFQMVYYDSFHYGSSINTLKDCTEQFGETVLRGHLLTDCRHLSDVCVTEHGFLFQSYNKATICCDS